MSSAFTSFACKAETNKGNDLVDFTVAILGAEGTGKTALLEVLCLHQFDDDDDDGHTVNEVRIVTREPNSVKQQPQRQSMDLDKSTGLSNGMIARGPERQQQQLDVPAGCNPNDYLPSSKRTKFENTTKPNKCNQITTRCKLPHPNSVRLLQHNMNDPKHPGIARRIFQVEVDEPFVELQEGTGVTFLDIPSLSSAEFPEHNNFVSDKWDIIDCVIVVMDTREDVDCKERKEELYFVEEMCRTRKSVPVLVVCNKMDSYELCEHQKIHAEQMNLLSSVFGGVTSMIDQSAISRDYNGWNPAFLPTSVRDAGFYRFGSILHYDEFQKCADITRVNRLGLQVKNNPAWNKLNEKERIFSAFQILKDPFVVDDMIAATNFHKFGVILQVFVSMSKTVQVRGLLAQKINDELASLVSFERYKTITKLTSLIKEYDLIKLQRSDLVKKYRGLFEEYRQSKIDDFRRRINVKCLHDIMDELALYHVFCGRFELKDELCWAENTMEAILREQLQIIIKAANTWNIVSWKASIGKTERNLQEWKDLSPFDWQRIFSSLLLLMRCEVTFCKSFGPEILILEQNQSKFQVHSMCCSTLTCRFIPCNDPLHKSLMLSWSILHSKEGYKDCFDDDYLAKSFLQTLREPDDPNHWGHVAWMFLKYKKGARP